jgi:predicted RNase H-like nuclease (RuvC/YqgF family)
MALSGCRTTTTTDPLKATTGDLVREPGRFRRAKDAKEAELRKLEASLEALRRGREPLADDVAELQSSVIHLRTELDAVNAEIEELKRQHAAAVPTPVGASAPASDRVPVRTERQTDAELERLTARHADLARKYQEQAELLQFRLRTRPVPPPGSPTGSRPGD